MTTDPQPDVAKGSAFLRKVFLVLRLSSPVFFGAWMAAEWREWPNGSPFLGPLGIMWYNGFGDGLVPTTFLLPMIFAFPLRPHPVTAALSLLGLLAWYLLGVVAQGIAC